MQLLMARGMVWTIVEHARTESLAVVGMSALMIVAFGLAAGYARLCCGFSPPANGFREIDP
jgi:hypothetical protein